MDASKGYTGIIVGSLAVAPWDDRVIFVNGFRSNDGGSTWKAAASFDLPIGAAYRFSPNKGQGGFPIIYGSSSEEMFISEDGGNTWKSYSVIDINVETSLGLVTACKNPMNAFAIAPSNPNIMYVGFGAYGCFIDEYNHCLVPAPPLFPFH